MACTMPGMDKPFTDLINRLVEHFGSKEAFCAHLRISSETLRYWMSNQQVPRVAARLLGYVAEEALQLDRTETEKLARTGDL